MIAKPRRVTTSSTWSSRCATLDDLAAVRRRVDVRVAADECIRSLDDARALRALDAADVIVLKQQPLGGVRAALDVAEAAGVPAVVSSMMETSVGIAAGVALAAALPELPYACGLATLRALAGDVDAHPARAGRRRAAGATRSRPTPTSWRATQEVEQVSDALGLLEVARVSGARRSPRRARRGSASAIRCAMSTYLASSPPTISSTGIRSSPRRSQFDGCAPWPSTRSCCGERLDRVGGASFVDARRARVAASRTAVARASVRGTRRHRRARSPARAARRRRGGRRARRDRRCPATRSPARAARTTSGRSSASCRHSRPPCE